VKAGPEAAGVKREPKGAGKGSRIYPGCVVVFEKGEGDLRYGQSMHVCGKAPSSWESSQLVQVERKWVANVHRQLPRKIRQNVGYVME
jgi:hypothetical protein